jgi:hypothetical protein
MSAGCEHFRRVIDWVSKTRPIVGTTDRSGVLDTEDEFSNPVLEERKLFQFNHSRSKDSVGIIIGSRVSALPRQ